MENTCLLLALKQKKHDFIIQNLKEISAGQNGHIYEKICKENDCEYVVKIIVEKQGYTNKKDIENEIIMQNKCSEEKLCIKVEYNSFGKNCGIIIMKRLEKTLLTAITEMKNDIDKKKIIELAINMITDLHKNARIIHNDCHLENYMIDKDNNLFFIDMGISEDIPECKEDCFDIFDNITTDYEILRDSLKQHNIFDYNLSDKIKKFTDYYNSENIKSLDILFKIEKNTFYTK